MNERSTPKGGGIDVVIADGDVLAREGLKWLLTDEAFRVVSAVEDGVALVDALDTHRVDLVVVADNVLQSYGLKALLVTEMKRVNGNLKVVLVGRTIDPHFMIGCLRAGVDGCVLKNASPETILQTVRRVARGEVPVISGCAEGIIQRFSPWADHADGTGRGFVLTKRQQDVLDAMIMGMTNRDIAAHLFLSETTVKTHVSAILKKLGAADRTQAVIIALGRRPALS